ncbi:MAG: ATP-binding protein [Bacteroidales bacterium]|nr:ATP-binding protein [Bacteroidales bacterium]MBQ9639910.1 ATP-binding protein [Bacteroidales bacterium]
MERITIQSDIAEISKVESFVSNICDNHNLDRYFASITMAVVSAVDNAIRHGNHSVKEKKVVIESAVVRGGISFSVEDEGEGFDYQHHGHIDDDATGNGMIMMRMLADEVEYSEGGRRVNMLFAVSGIDEALANQRCRVLKQFSPAQVLNV